MTEDGLTLVLSKEKLNAILKRKMKVLIENALVSNKDWDFKISTSSPYYPKSNGLAERGFGKAKSMLQKAKEENKDLSLY